MNSPRPTRSVARQPTTLARPRTYAQRLDPTGRTARQALLLRVFARAPFRQLLRLMRVPATVLDRGIELSRAYGHLVSELERTAPVLAPLGWVVHGLAPTEAYSAAATLVERGQLADAEEVLVRAYNDGEGATIRFYRRVASLYQEDTHSREVGLARLRLLDEAYELHRQGRYCASIALVLSQIDGIFADKAGQSAASFYDARNPRLVDNKTLAGHPLGLQQLSRLLGQPHTRTTVGDRLTRHGILHGRVLGYGTLLNSTKTWAALLVVIDAAEKGALSAHPPRM